MTFMMEQLLTLVRRGLSDDTLERLHSHNRQTQEAVQRRQTALNASREADPNNDRSSFATQLRAHVHGCA